MTFSRFGILSLVVAAVLLLAGLWAALRLGDVGPVVGRPAPAFRLQGFDGQAIDLEQLRGKVVLVNFWASWCVECAAEAAQLEQLWRDRKSDGLVVLGVNYTDTEPAAREYLKRFDITYPNGPDLGARVSRSYGLTGVPETVLIDREGNVVGLPVAPGRLDGKLVGPVGPGSPIEHATLTALVDAELARRP